jgi:hypothetical protein
MEKHCKQTIRLLVGVLGLMIFLSACGGNPTPQPSVSATPEAAASQTALPIQALTPKASQPATMHDDATPDPLLDLPYTEDDPLTDPEEILQILDELQRRELAWFSRPGWVQFTSVWAGARDYSGTQHIWTHITTPDRDCSEQFYYFEHGGEFLPYGIRRSDGVVGYIRPILEGQFQYDTVYETSPSCDLGDGASLWIGTGAGGFVFHDEASQARAEIQRDIPASQLQVWLVDGNGSTQLVLMQESVFSDSTQRGTVADPETGIMVPVARNLKFKYIELETGLLLRDVEEFYDDDDQLITGSHEDDEKGLWYAYQFYEMLPEVVSQVYEEAAEALNAYIEGENSD